MKWKFVKADVPGKCELFGVCNIFDYDWQHMNETVRLKDPIYGNKISFPIYRVSIDGKEYKFAAGEFSNNVSGFFVPKE